MNLMKKSLVASAMFGSMGIANAGYENLILDFSALGGSGAEFASTAFGATFQNVDIDGNSVTSSFMQMSAVTGLNFDYGFTWDPLQPQNPLGISNPDGYTYDEVAANSSLLGTTATAIATQALAEGGLGGVVFGDDRIYGYVNDLTNESGTKDADALGLNDGYQLSFVWNYSVATPLAPYTLDIYFDDLTTLSVTDGTKGVTAGAAITTSPDFFSDGAWLGTITLTSGTVQNLEPGETNSFGGFWTNVADGVLFREESNGDIIAMSAADLMDEAGNYILSVGLNASNDKGVTSGDISFEIPEPSSILLLGLGLIGLGFVSRKSFRVEKTQYGQVLAA